MSIISRYCRTHVDQFLLILLSLDSEMFLFFDDRVIVHDFHRHHKGQIDTLYTYTHNEQSTKTKQYWHTHIHTQRHNKNQHKSATYAI